MAPELVVAEHQLPTNVVIATEQDELAPNLAAQEESRHDFSRHLHQLPDRRNDEFSDAFSGAGELDFNA